MSLERHTHLPKTLRTKQLKQSGAVYCKVCVCLRRTFYSVRLLTFCAGHEDNAIRAMAQLNRDAAAKGLTKNALLIDVPFCEPGGIRSRELVCYELESHKFILVDIHVIDGRGRRDYRWLAQ
jgi:hypothetical protein